MDVFNLAEDSKQLYVDASKEEKNAAVSRPNTGSQYHKLPPDKLSELFFRYFSQITL